MDNKLYSYTSLTEAIASLSIDCKWLRIKQGQTILNTVKGRVKQQDNASTTSDLIVLSEMIVPNNEDVKLDDKVREEQHKQPFFRKYTRYNHEDKRDEWSETRIDDIIDLYYPDGFLQFNYDLGQTKNVQKFIYDELLSHPIFLENINDRIFRSKTVAIKKILNKDTYHNIRLRPWQKEVCDEMIAANRKYMLLSLAPRFGKTYLTLEYSKRLAEELAIKYPNKRILLVPASKNLSSNTSFINDYYHGGYNIHGNFDIFENASLFKDEKNIISELKKSVDENTLIVLVTDEADLASHTKISQEKINLINKNFNVIKQIAMSGTGIYKAAKIFKNVPDDEIFFKAINYTELNDYNCDELVKRRFVNIIIKPEELYKLTGTTEEFLNIRQTFEDPRTHKSMAKYLTRFIDEPYVDGRLGMDRTEIAMVFVSGAITKKRLNQFVNVFEENNPNLATLIITGDETSNRKAEEMTKEKIDLMYKANDNRKLVLFSRGMASRSFSVAKINRVIVMNDGFITPTFIQETARCLTYDVLKKGPQSADIIRISFEELELAGELFSLENERVDYEVKTLKKALRFLNNSSFTEVILNGSGKVDPRTWTDVDDNDFALALLDAALKFSDNTRYLMTKLNNLGITTDVEGIKTKSKSKVKTADTSIKNTTIGEKKKKAKTTGEKENERNLEQYLNLIRTLPYIFVIYGDRPKNIEELLNLSWKDLAISKKTFKKNLLIDDFRYQVEAIFRLASTDRITEEDILSKINDYHNSI